MRTRALTAGWSLEEEIGSVWQSHQYGAASRGMGPIRSIMFSPGTSQRSAPWKMEGCSAKKCSEGIACIKHTTWRSASMTKSYVGSFGYHFSLVDFVIKSMPYYASERPLSLPFGSALVIPQRGPLAGPLLDQSTNEQS